MLARLSYVASQDQIVRPGPSGIEKQLGQIPNCAGVYAWHHSYRRLCRLLEDGTVDDVYGALKLELERPHALTRSALFSEMGLRVSLASERQFNKDLEIREALLEPGFRDELRLVLHDAHLWQQPLYIGKASFGVL